MTARYFYLSYAHSPPLAGSRLDASTPDEWVREFFQDLSQAVNRRASPERGLAAGFIDLHVPSGQEWKETLVRALGEAEVFVPLYSPGYLSRSWPGREWACFAQRIEADATVHPGALGTAACRRRTTWNAGGPRPRSRRRSGRCLHRLPG